MRYAMLDDPRYQALTPTEKLLLHHIEWFSLGSGTCWRSAQTLANGIGTSRSTIMRGLRTLKELGLIEVYQEDGKTHRSVTSDTRAISDTTGVSYMPPPSVTSDTPPVSPVTPKVKGEVKGKVKEKYIDQNFSAFWSEYPRKVGKRAAAKAFTAAMKRGTPEDIIAGIQHIEASEPQYIPHPTTWLNRDGWLDQPTAPKRTFSDRLNEHLDATEQELQRTDADGIAEGVGPAGVLPLPDRVGRRDEDEVRPHHRRDGEQSHLKLIKPRRI